ncbi:MAG: DUF599 family protein [Rhodospirillaceae bacterium]|nr:DUF599 family protein [Rhodospirillaceae bacterium]MCA8931441.1 DUF599 family protein [Rhodospirillaceae bacterium]
MMQVGWPDWSALAVFVVAWIGYSWYADSSRAAARNMTSAVNRVRYVWMRQMLDRDLRMVDTNILGNLVNGIAFFASTAILVIGGLIALLGSADEALMALSHLPVVTTLTRESLELRVLTLLVLFTYAFFKFAWAFRLSNYCSILVGAAPRAPVPDAHAEAVAQRIAHVHGLVGFHFNRGLRAYYFALAVVAWFVHAIALVVAVVVIVHELWQREFRSRALADLTAAGEEPPPPDRSGGVA